MMMHNQLKYQPHIDGLRAIAVLAVIFFHAFPELNWGGFVGVDIFFVISGYLITKILLTDMVESKFSILNFYARRIRRIFPSLIVVLAFSIFVGSIVLMADEYQSLAKEVIAGVGFVSNLLFMQQVGYFDTVAETKPLLHLWSLGVEEQFYIFWPFILLGMYKLSFHHIQKITVILIVLLVCLGSHYTTQNPSIAYYSPIVRFWELLLGALLAIQQIRHGELWTKKFSDLNSWLGIILIVLAFALINKSKDFPGLWALLPTVGALLIISSAPNSWLNRHVLSSNLLVFLGLISYPLYLWHWPLLSFNYIVEGQTPSLLFRIASLFLCLILSWMTYRFIEKPIRENHDTRLVVGSLILAILIVAFLAYKIHQNHGQKYHLLKSKASSEASISTKQWLGDQRKNCKARYGLGLCFSNVPLGADTQTLFIGDSHADVVSAGAIKNFPELRASSFSAYSCPPFLDLIRLQKHQVKDCGAFVQGILDLFAKSPNQTVVLIARYAFYESGNGFVQAGQRLTEPEGHIRTSEKLETSQEISDSEVFSISLRKTFDVLTQQGKKIVFVYQVPELGFDPKLCISRPLRKSNHQCKVARQLVDDRQISYRRVVKEVLKDYPKVTTFDPLLDFCDDKFCYGGKGDEIYYKDDDHLSVIGSSLIATRLRNRIIDAGI